MSGDVLHETHVQSPSSRVPAFVPWVVGGLLVFTLLVFALATPGGLLRKLDMVGYAVCHQIGSHSFVVGGRELPLCARCTGTFLGAMIGLFGQAAILRRGRASGFPPPAVLSVLVGFTLSWAADGVNSYLALLGGPHLYRPTNVLRLITGSLNGLTMSALIYPLFNVSVWQRPADRPSIQGLRDLGILLALEAGLIGLVLSRQRFLLYPLAVLSAFAVLTLLSTINSVLAVVVLGRENGTETWREAVLPISIGLLLSFLQIGLIDVIRYALTGTLDGIPSLQ